MDKGMAWKWYENLPPWRIEQVSPEGRTPSQFAACCREAVFAATYHAGRLGAMQGAATELGRHRNCDQAACRRRRRCAARRPVDWSLGDPTVPLCVGDDDTFRAVREVAWRLLGERAAQDRERPCAQPDLASSSVEGRRPR